MGGNGRGGGKMNPYFIGNLDTRLINDDRAGLSELLAEFGFYSAKLKRKFTAPIGFRTDFCSVPRVPLAYTILGNRARKTGTIHDWLYTSHEVTREEADELLREMLVINGVSACEAEEFYLAVRAFGGSHWEPAAAA
jgi:hypothetical protein